MLKLKKMMAALLTTVLVFSAFAGSVAAASEKGWVKKSGCWYYYENGQKICNRLVKIDGDWYFFDNNGRMKSDDDCYYDYNDELMRQLVDESWCGYNHDTFRVHFDSTGRFSYLQYWDCDNCIARFVDKNSSLVCYYKWNSDDTSVWFDADGNKITGWYRMFNEWYYFNGEGNRMSGWQRIGGVWYYFDKYSDDAMLTGYQSLDDGRYYFDANGKMAIGWRQTENDWI